MRDRAPAILALAVTLTACSPAASEAPDAAVPPPSSGQASPAIDPRITGTFAANGRDLFIDCIGQGSPTFVLEGGEGASSDAMGGLKHALAERGIACSYDRANLGRSGSAPTPRTAAEVVADLNALLSEASAPGPYLLVGHSAGGMFVQLYARTFQQDVAGVLAMNPVPPFAAWQEQGFPEMTERERAEETAYFSGENAESFDYRASSQQIDDLPAPPGVPFELLISTIAQCVSPDDICGRTYSAYESIMKAVSQEWPNGGFSQVASGHEIYLGDLESLLAVVDRLITRIR